LFVLSNSSASDVNVTEDSISNMSLQWFGTISVWESTGYTSAGYPDPNMIPISQRKATGHEIPWNMIRNDACNPLQAYYTNNIPNWKSKMALTQDYCKTHGMALMFQFWYPAYQGQTAWSTLEEMARNIAPYLEGYPSYMIVGNEILSGNANAPIGGINSSPFAELGGAGSSGIDGFVQYIKNLRAIVPSTCKLGINEYNAMDEGSSAGTWNLQPAINVHTICKNKGARLDYFGAEGYWMNTNYSNYANPVDLLNKTCNQFGDAVGDPIIYSEWMPMHSQKGPNYWPKQSDAWKNLLQAMSDNKYVIGITGPWGGWRVGSIWKDGYGGEKLNWGWNDTNSNAPGDPDQNGQIGPGAVTPTIPWLQTWVPANVGGTIPPEPIPPEPIPPDMTTLVPGSYTLQAGQYAFTVSGGPSPDKTTVPPATSITDSNNDVWTIANGVAMKNAAPAGFTANVAKLAYVSQKVYQQNQAGSWWYWNGSDWVGSQAPI
jgi:hypothetical protein